MYNSRSSTGDDFTGSFKERSLLDTGDDADYEGPIVIPSLSEYLAMYKIDSVTEGSSLVPFPFKFSEFLTRVYCDCGYREAASWD